MRAGISARYSFEGQRRKLQSRAKAPECTETIRRAASGAPCAGYACGGITRGRGA